MAFGPDRTKKKRSAASEERLTKQYGTGVRDDILKQHPGDTMAPADAHAVAQSVINQYGMQKGAELLRNAQNITELPPEVQDQALAGLQKIRAQQQAEQRLSQLGVDEDYDQQIRRLQGLIPNYDDQLDELQGQASLAQERNLGHLDRLMGAQDRTAQIATQQLAGDITGSGAADIRQIGRKAGDIGDQLGGMAAEGGLNRISAANQAANQARNLDQAAAQQRIERLNLATRDAAMRGDIESAMLALGLRDKEMDRSNLLFEKAVDKARYEQVMAEEATGFSPWDVIQPLAVAAGTMFGGPAGGTIAAGGTELIKQATTSNEDEYYRRKYGV